MQSWDDDAAVFYERSLGDIVNGADLPSGAASRRTGALYVASNLPATPVTADDGGWVEVRYGEDGNALAVTVHGQCGDPSLNSIPLDCRPSGSSDPAEAIALSCAYSCAAEQHFTYAWDEVNRIHHARRFDRANGASWELAVEQRYLYDASNQRTVKTTTFRGLENGAERTALYVYPGDYERRGLQTTFDRTSYEAISGDTETQYGVGGARIVWRTGTRDDGLDRDQRITISLTDLIQSTTAVIDLATGELVESGSYYPNGARETYRSNESEAVAPEPMGFTGKEADEEVGLTYFGHRYLMAHLGRWASPDPLQTHAVGGGEAVNGYHYVGGSLLAARDPLGLDLTFTFRPTTDGWGAGGPTGERREALRDATWNMARELQTQLRDFFGIAMNLVGRSGDNVLTMRFDAEGDGERQAYLREIVLANAIARGATDDEARQAVADWEVARQALVDYLSGNRQVFTSYTNYGGGRLYAWHTLDEADHYGEIEVNPMTYSEQGADGVWRATGRIEASSAGAAVAMGPLFSGVLHEPRHVWGCMYVTCINLGDEQVVTTDVDRALRSLGLPTRGDYVGTSPPGMARQGVNDHGERTRPLEDQNGHATGETITFPPGRIMDGDQYASAPQ